MTIPFSPSPEASTPYVGGSEGFVIGAAFSALNNRTEGNVKSQLAAQMQNDNTWSALWDVFFGFIKAPFEWVWAAMKRLFPFIDWQSIEEFDFWATAAWVIDQLEQVPFVGDIVTWITGATSGTWETLQVWFGNVREFFAHINFFADDFDLLAAAEDFLDFILFPVGRLASMAGLEEVAAFVFGISSAITGFVGTSISGTIATVTEWFGNLKEFFAHINFLDPNFDLLAAAEDFIDFILFPVGKIADMLQLDEIWDWLSDFVSDLFNFPAQFIGSIGSVLMDGVASVGGFLSGLWGALTGQSGSGKTVANVATAAGGVASTAGTAFTNAQNALNSLGDLVWKLLNAPAQVLGSIGGVIMDGVASIGSFLTGLWQSLTGQSGSNKTVADVALASTAVTATTNTASANASQALTNNQSTVDNLFDAFDGTTGASGKTVSQMRQRGANVRTSAVTGEANAGTALTNAATAQTQANLGVTNAAAAQTAAGAADTKAVAAQGFANNALKAGSNILPNGGFENTSFYTGNGVYETAVKLSGSYSMRLTGPAARINLTTGFQSADTFVNSQPCRPLSTFYVEGWVYGDPANVGGGSINLYINDYNAAGVLQPQQAVGMSATTALRGVWNKVYGTITVSANAASVYIFIYHSGTVPAGDKYYYDNFVAYEITEAQAAQLDADAAQAQANTATTNAATADGKAVVADGKAVTAQSAAATADGKAVTAQAAAATADGKAVTAQSAAATADGKAVTAQAAAVTADGKAVTATANAAAADAKAVAAQTAVDSATALLNASVTAGANLIPDPGFEDATLDAARKATSGSVSSWWNAVTDVVKSGSRAMEVTYASSGAAYPSLNLVPSLKSTWSSAPSVRIPCKPGQVFYMSQWVYLRSPNSGSREMNLYLATFNQANTIQYQFVQAFPALDTWVKIEAYFVVSRSDVVSVAPMFGAFRPGQQLNAKAVVDDVVMIDVTDAYNAKVAADAAQAQANTATTNAATADGKAVVADGKAVTAQSAASTADGKAVAAQTAAATADGKAVTAQNAASTADGKAVTAQNAAATADGKAVTAQAAATAADGKAVTAQAAAVTADGKAVTAQGTIDGIATSNNRVISPNFEDSTVARMKWSAFNNGTIDYTTAEFHQGTQSLRYTINTAGWNGFYLAPTPTKYRVACKPGDVISASIMAKAKATNATAGYMYLYIRFVNTGAGGGQTDAGTGNWFVNLATWNGAWIELNNIGTCPADRDAYEVFWLANGGAAVGNVYYLDTAVVREETTARTALTTAGTAQANAATGIANAATAQAAATTADGKAVTAQTAAATADGKAVSAQTAAATADGKAVTAQTAAATADGKAVTADGKAVTAQNAAATADGKAVTAQTNVQTTWNDLYDAFEGTSGSTGRTSTEVRTRGAAVRSTANTASTNAGTALTNAATADGKAVTAQTANQDTLNNLFDAFDGTTGNTGKTAVNVRTRGAAVRSSAVTGEANAGTALTNASIADGKAVTATANAAAADAKALVAQNALASAITSGANLCANSGFENTDFKLLDVNNTSYSTEFKRSGSRSVKLVGLTGANIDVSFFSSTASGKLQLPVQAGDVLYFEAWVRGGTGSTKIGGGIRPYLYSGDPAAPTVSYPANIADYAGTLATLNAGWNKVSGYYTVPAGGVGLEVVVQLHTSAGTGCILHVDDIVCYRVTEAVAAETKALAAQSSIDLRARDFQNLVAGLDFALGAASPWVFTASQGYTIATDQARSGTHSMKVTGSAVVASAVASYDNFRTFEVKAGEQFYIELWARRTSDYVNNDTGGPRFRMARGAGGSTIVDIQLRAVNIPTADTWTKLTATGTVPSDGTTAVSFGMISASSTVAGSVWMDDVVVRRVAVPDAIAVLPQTKVTDLPANLSTISTAATNAGNTAGTALTNAATADGKAVTAQAAAATADGKAVTAQAAAATADGKAVTADGKAVTAQAAAVTADGKAVTATTNAETARKLAATAITSGTNLIPDPMFDSGLTLNYGPSAPTYVALSAEQKFSGAQSLKVVVPPSGGASIFPMSDNVSYGYNFPCQPGDVFYCEYQIFGKSTNTQNSGAVGNLAFGITVSDSAGASIGSYYAIAANATTAHNGVWTKYSGYVTIPAGATVRGTPFLRLGSALTPGETYYFDNLVFYRVSESAAINTALYGTGVNTPAANILAGAVPGLQASKITSGEFGSAQIAASAITTAKIATGAVTSNEIGASAVTNAKVATDAVASANIQASAVTNAKVATDAIATANLQATAVTTAKIADAGITGLKIAAGTIDAGTKLSGTVSDAQIPTITNAKLGSDIDAAKLTAGTLSVSRIADAAITGTKIAATTIGAGNIADSAVTDTKIATDAVTAVKIASNAITDVKINAGAVTNAKVATDAIAAANIQASAVTTAKIGDAQITGLKVAASTIDAGTKLTGTVADGQLGPIRDLAIGQINSGANLLPNPGFERLGFVSSSLFVTEQKRSGTRSLKLTANGANYAGHGLFSDNVASFNVSVAPNDVYYYEVWYLGHASNPRHRQLQVSATGGTFTITVGANTTTAIAFNATAATVQAALVALASVGAGNATVTAVSGASLNVSPGLTIVFGASVTGAISTTSSLTGGGLNLFNNSIFMQASSVNQNGVATGYPAVSVASDDSDNGVWKKMSGYVTIPAGTAELPTVSTDFRQYMNYPMPAGVIYYFDDAFLARVTEANQINKALYGPTVNAPAAQILTATIPNGVDATKLSGTVDIARIPTITNAKLDTGIDASKLTAGTLPVDRIANAALTNAKLASDIDAAKLTAGTLSVDRIASAAITGAKIAGTTITSTNLADNAVVAAKIAADAVTDAKIASNAVTGVKIAADAVTDVKIASNAVTSGKIADAQVTGTKIAANTIDAGTKLTGTVADAQIPQLPQSKVDGLPADVTVNSTLLNHTQKIQTLESTLLATESQGKTMSVKFSDYPDGALPATFTVEYPVGTGTSTIQIVGGIARWVAGTTADRTARIVYTGDANENGKTLTNFQSIRGTLGTIPGLGATGVNGPRFWAIGRVSDDRASYVWARAFFTSGTLTSLRGEMGCTINGVETIWRTNIPLTWSLDMTFVCGANGNPRAYQVYSGSTLVSSYEEGFTNLAGFPSPGVTGRLYVANDTGLRYTWNGTAYVSSASSASLLGDSTATSNYRRWGAITEAKVVSGTLRDGGAVAAAVTSDNAVSPYKGSVARMIRTSTATASFASGENVLPQITAGSAGFFITQYETLDVDSDDVNGIFTVAKSKMYMVTSRIRLTTYVDAVVSINLQLRLAGSSTWNTVQRGSAKWNDDWKNVGLSNGGLTGSSIDGTWLQYLNVGDSIRLTTQRAGGSSTVMTGTANGAETYFAIAGLT